jgi:hypothetical protein
MVIAMSRLIYKRLKALMVGLLLVCAISSGPAAFAVDTTNPILPNYTMKAGERKHRSISD